MTGGHVQDELLAPEDVVSLLLDDAQLEQKLREIPLQVGFKSGSIMIPFSRTQLIPFIFPWYKNSHPFPQQNPGARIAFNEKGTRYVRAMNEDKRTRI